MGFWSGTPSSGDKSSRNKRLDRHEVKNLIRKAGIHAENDKAYLEGKFDAHPNRPMTLHEAEEVLRDAENDTGDGIEREQVRRLRKEVREHFNEHEVEHHDDGDDEEHDNDEPKKHTSFF